MNREIKFRGKNIVTGEWVYGYLVKGEMIGSIIMTGEYHANSRSEYSDGFTNYEVISETVGQYTGLKDKNNVDIYGGEIIFNDDRNEHAIVTYSEERAMFICTYVESNDVFPLWQTLSNLYYSVGNIYENKNLLTAQ